MRMLITSVAVPLVQRIHSSYRVCGSHSSVLMLSLRRCLSPMHLPRYLVQHERACSCSVMQYHSSISRCLATPPMQAAGGASVSLVVSSRRKPRSQASYSCRENRPPCSILAGPLAARCQHVRPESSRHARQRHNPSPPSSRGSIRYLCAIKGECVK